MSFVCSARLRCLTHWKAIVYSHKAANQKMLQLKTKCRSEFAHPLIIKTSTVLAMENIQINFSLWILWKLLLIKPFWEGVTPKHTFPRTFFYKLRFCKLWWESLKKAKKEIHRARLKHDCNPVMGRVGTFPHFASLLTCCYANSIR